MKALERKTLKGADAALGTRVYADVPLVAVSNAATEHTARAVGAEMSATENVSLGAKFKKALTIAGLALFTALQIWVKNYIFAAIISAYLFGFTFEKQITVFCQRKGPRLIIATIQGLAEYLLVVGLGIVGFGVLFWGAAVIGDIASKSTYFKSTIDLQRSCESDGGAPCARLVKRCESGDADGCIAMSGIRKTQGLKREGKKYLLRACDLGNNYACGLLK